MISGTGNNNFASYYLNQISLNQGASQTQSKNSTDGTQISVNGCQQCSGNTTADELTLSEEGLQMAEMMSGSGEMQGMKGERPSGPPPGGKPPGGKPPGGVGETGGTSYAEQLEEEEEAFYASLMSKLEEAGVDTTDMEIELGYDEEGNIVVTNDDVSAEDKAAIESILAEDAELAQTYANLKEMESEFAEMEAQMAEGRPEGPPPDKQGMPNGMQNGQMSWMADGQFANTSSIASAYASQSTMSSNAIQVQVAAS